VATRRVYEADCGIPAEELASLENDTERLSDNWITSGRKALAFVQARGGLNMIMTAAPLRATVAKLNLFGMAKYVPFERVYSSNGSKEAGGKRDVGAAIEAAKLIAGKKPKIIEPPPPGALLNSSQVVPITREYLMPIERQEMIYEYLATYHGLRCSSKVAE
jgi:hypothetical protein